MRSKKQTPTSRRTANSPKQANVFSYHASRAGSSEQRARYESPKQAQGRRLGTLRHVPTIFAGITVFLCMVYISFLNNQPRVSVAASEAGRSLERPTEVYEKFISDQLDKSFANKNKFTLDSRPIVLAIQRQFPEVANAVVTVPLVGQRPIVKIAVTSPAFVLANQSGAYYINEAGIPLAKVSEVMAELPGVTSVADESGIPIEVGRQVLPKDTVTFTSQLLEQLNATNTPVQSVVLPVEANEVQVRVEGTSYIVRFNSKGNARLQVGTYLAVANRLSSTNVMPKEYIDVRVEERAYYK